MHISNMYSSSQTSLLPYNSQQSSNQNDETVIESSSWSCWDPSVPLSEISHPCFHMDEITGMGYSVKPY